MRIWASVSSTRRVVTVFRSTDTWKARRLHIHGNHAAWPGDLGAVERAVGEIVPLFNPA
jgi:hypothetical protein